MIPAVGWYCARCGLRENQPGLCRRDGLALLAVDGLLGRVAGNYTLVSVLGQGGMGEVLRGVNPTLEAEVAVKILNTAPSAGSPDAARFLIEAVAVNRVAHDGVVKILDGGYLDIGRPYLVMELLDGESLEALLTRTPRVDPDQAVRVISDVLEIVAVAHAAGIVHRDLKPANVFLGKSGRTRVLDFGVAKLLDGSSTATRTGAMVGTPAYMAPEQIHAGTVDGRTDVYAAGIMLFEMLVGQRPFSGPTQFAIAQAHVTQPIPRLPPEHRALQAIIDRALAKSPADRFGSAAAMRDALSRPPRSRPGTPPPVAARAPRWWIPATGLVVAGGITALVLGLRGSSETPTVALPASGSAETAAAVVARDAGIGRDAKSLGVEAIIAALDEVMQRRKLFSGDLGDARAWAGFNTAVEASDLRRLQTEVATLVERATTLEIDRHFLERRWKAGKTLLYDRPKLGSAIERVALDRYLTDARALLDQAEFADFEALGADLYEILVTLQRLGGEVPRDPLRVDAPPEPVRGDALKRGPLAKVRVRRQYDEVLALAAKATWDAETEKAYREKLDLVLDALSVGKLEFAKRNLEEVRMALRRFPPK